MLNLQIAPRDAEIIRLQFEAAPTAEDEDEFFQSLVEDHEDITLADASLFRRFFDEDACEFSGMDYAVADLAFELAAADPEEIIGSEAVLRATFRFRAHLMAALKLYAKAQARKEIEKDSVPDIYASDFYSHF